LNPLLLKRVPMFKGLDDTDLQAIADHTTTHTYPRNTILMHEGEPPDAMYVVMEGRVKIYVSDTDGKELVLDSLSPGEFFGELALIDGSPRSATVVTTTETTISKILKTEFDHCLEASPKIAINLLKSLSKRIRILNDNVKDLALLDVYGRVASTILRLAHERRGIMITDPITQQELANMVGASREMVSRVIKTLKSEGYISISSKQITILSTLPTAHSP
jgi:CRP/FNR family cyclic AMP-dependent transcriptional regulator